MRRVLCLLLLGIMAASAPAQTVRIGVFTLFHPSELLIEPAGPQAVVVSGGGPVLVLSEERGHSRAAVHFHEGRLLLDSAEVTSVRASARNGGAADFFVSVPGRIRRHYRGVLTVSERGGELVPVVEMDRETAVASIVAAESPPGAPLEALKAQAVVARSFLSAENRHGGYDFCDTTHCQFLRDPPPAASPAARAARATRGLVLAWHGRPLAAMYSSRCGGHTLSLRDLGTAPTGYPYFAVECAYCRRHPADWKRTLSASDAERVAAHDESSRLALGREHGWAAIPSNLYVSHTSAAGVTLQGHGSGHGLGLCQYGAAGMAAQGADFAAILRHYYPETEIMASTQPAAP